LFLKQLRQLIRINPRNWNMSAHPIHDQGKQKENQALFQVAELPCLRLASRGLR